MSDPTGKRKFRGAYKGHPPWDISGPQPALREIADQLTGKLLDAGCGTGENALYFACLGRVVVALDFVQQPLKQAAIKAKERGLTLETRQGDALQLASWNDQFDGILDSGLFHTFSDEHRPRYVQGLWHVLRPQGRIALLCMSDREPAGNGPRRVSQSELKACFQQGWHIDSITPVIFQVRDDLPTGYFSPEGPHAWRMLATRT